MAWGSAQNFVQDHWQAIQTLADELHWLVVDSDHEPKPGQVTSSMTGHEARRIMRSAGVIPARGVRR